MYFWYCENISMFFFLLGVLLCSYIYYFCFLLIFKILLQSNGLHYGTKYIFNSISWEFHTQVLHIISTFTFPCLIPHFPLSFPNLWPIFIVTYIPHTQAHTHTHYKVSVAHMYMCLGLTTWGWIIYQEVHVWRILTNHPTVLHLEVRVCDISPTLVGLVTGVVIM